MAKRRVFRTRVKCPRISTDVGTTANQHALIGRTVALERSAASTVSLLLDGTVVGDLNQSIATKVASAIDRGQTFSATVENAFPTYDEKFKPSGAHLDIKVEYQLEKGQPGIETERCWRCLSATEPHQTTRSFFTTVAGVTFEGRQRIVARCSVGERLVLVRDPENRFDRGAIKVMRLNGEQLGFIPAHVSRGGDSSGLAFRMDRGGRYDCRIKDLTGGKGKTLGVNISITEAEEDEQLGTAKTAPNRAPQVALTSAPENQAWLWVLGAGALVVAVLVTALIAGSR